MSLWSVLRAVLLLLLLFSWFVSYLFYKEKQKLAFWLAFVLPVLLVVVASVAEKPYRESRECTANLRDLAQALELYAYSGPEVAFPPSLDYLQPAYYDHLPLCQGHPYRYEVLSCQAPGLGFTVRCSGKHPWPFSSSGYHSYIYGKGLSDE